MYGVSATVAPTTTIGIVDWHQDPTVASDLNAYRSKFGLPTCTVASGCFTELAAGSGKVAVASKGEIGEITLDVDAVSAICPTCHITLVDAASGKTGDLFPAVKSLASTGVQFISMSWSVPESASAATHNSYFAQPNTLYVAASGDNGYHDKSGNCGGTPVCYPAAAPGVIAAGGVSTTQDSKFYYFSAWKGAGSGCASYAPEAPAQAAAIGDPCAGGKPVADISALADPNTGAATYSTAFGWGVFGGTSLATPLITALFALSGNDSNPYAFYANNAAHPGLVFDVTSGASTGCAGTTVCTAGSGWDGPTGLGVPTTPQLFAISVANTVTLIATHGTTATVPLGQSLAGAAFTASGASGHYSWSASGLPPGMTIDSATGSWQGAPTSGGVYPVVITAADAQNPVVVSSATFTLTVQSPLILSTASGAHPRVLALRGRRIDTAPVSARGATSALTWAATGLPNGLALDPATGVLTGTPTKAGDSRVVVDATTTAGDTESLTVDFEVVEPYGCSNYLAARKGFRVSDDCGAYWSTTPRIGVGFVRLPGDISYSARGLPAGLRINADTGVVSGTPLKRGNGSFHFTTHIRPDGVMLTKATSMTSTVAYTVRS
jgi:hypothetical protein